MALNLSAFLLCLDATRSPTGVFSIHDIPDLLTITSSLPNMPPSARTLVCYVRFFADSTHRLDVSVHLEDPSGTHTPLFTMPVQPSSTNHGVVIAHQVTLSFNQPGTHWLHLSISRQNIARVPITVDFQRTPYPWSRIPLPLPGRI